MGNVAACVLFDFLLGKIKPSCFLIPKVWLSVRRRFDIRSHPIGCHRPLCAPFLFRIAGFPKSRVYKMQMATPICVLVSPYSPQPQCLMTSDSAPQSVSVPEHGRPKHKELRLNAALKPVCLCLFRIWLVSGCWVYEWLSGSVCHVIFYFCPILNHLLSALFPFFNDFLLNFPPTQFRTSYSCVQCFPSLLTNLCASTLFRKSIYRSLHFPPPHRLRPKPRGTRRPRPPFPGSPAAPRRLPRPL